MHVTWASDVTA